MSACIGERPRVPVEKVQRHLPCGFRIGDRLSAVGLCVGPFRECPESGAGAVVPVASDSRIGELDSLTAPVISNVDAGVRQRLSAGLTGRGPKRRTERPVPFWSGFGIVIAPGWPTAFAPSGPSSEPKGPAVRRGLGGPALGQLEIGQLQPLLQDAQCRPPRVRRDRLVGRFQHAAPNFGMARRVLNRGKDLVGRVRSRRQGAPRLGGVFNSATAKSYPSRSPAQSKFAFPNGPVEGVEDGAQAVAQGWLQLRLIEPPALERGIEPAAREKVGSAR